MGVFAVDIRWWVFVHLAGVLAFMTVHGTSVIVAFRVRAEGRGGGPDRERIRTLLQLSSATIVSLYASILVLLMGGIVSASQEHVWSKTWVKVSLGVFVAITLFMGGVARIYYAKIKDGLTSMSDADLTKRLRSSQPIAITVIGFGGLAAILWLMIFKPV